MDGRVLISDIQKFCVHDGPGIRTVVFFKGCPLRCRWCQNPEDLEARKILLFNEEKCTGCGRCREKCKKNAFVPVNGRMVLDRERCDGCGECAGECLVGAKSICGSEMTVEQVFREVMKDEVFFRNTGGGVTLSGGECTMHPEFVLELLQKCRDNGISTAIETCGYCNPDIFRAIADKVDLFLYDFKLYSQELHENWIGQKNDLIKKNLQYLMKMRKKIIIRIPLVIGVNDGAEYRKMMEYLQQCREQMGGAVQEIHIMPFHQIGSSKYRLSGHGYAMQDWAECSLAQAEEYAGISKTYGFKVNIGGWDFQPGIR